MSAAVGNLLNCPTYKIEDRKSILARSLDALLAEPDCRYEFRGEWKKLSAEETANWEARQTTAALLATFPASAAPLEKSEPEHEEPIAESAE